MAQRYLNIPVTDALAAERTQLAAERTFLAYVRSAFAFFVAGVSGSQLLETAWLVGVGYALSAMSVVVLAFGFYRLHVSRAVVKDLVSRIERERGAARAASGGAEVKAS
jgi:putative membrane protein